MLAYIGPGMGVAAIVIVVLVLLIIVASFVFLAWSYLSRLFRKIRSRFRKD